MKVPLGEDEVEICFHKGPGLQAKADSATVQSIVQHLNRNYDTCLAAGREIRNKKSAVRKGGPQELLDTASGQEIRKEPTSAGVDTNKIRFDFRRGAYIIMYKDGDGELHRLSKGLEVPRTDYTGGVMPADVYSKVKEQVLMQARQKWNTLDRSGADRLQIAACSQDGVTEITP